MHWRWAFAWQVCPAFGEYLDSLKFHQLSIPIGICLFFMMYPTVVGIAFSDVKKAASKPKPMLLTIIANWAIAPFIMTLYANIILQGNPQYITGVILLGDVPMHGHGYVVDHAG